MVTLCTSGNLDHTFLTLGVDKMEALPDGIHWIYRRGRHRETTFRSDAGTLPDLCRCASRRVTMLHDDTGL